ncbi:MAG: septum formation initiator family protein [Prevotellaceae bacterium]|jgi:cell division protein FtsB|nr:septum formation initiator family protein [Prevotellaceae bacterium]
MSESSQNKNRKIKQILLNKYVIVLLIFVVVIVFFDDNNLVSRIATDMKIKKLETEINYYKKIIETNKLQIRELQSDDANLEKFARQQYLMKKDNEDIFIIQEKK